MPPQKLPWMEIELCVCNGCVSGYPEKRKSASGQRNLHGGISFFGMEDPEEQKNKLWVVVSSQSI